ncbi:Uncharacterized protein Adt_31345 [Abeliophyllum distichum]|uniref:Uncharacterized protein n=1 Tax=Abeliophyllum distichum TaxID=126358 RepID=A0ABD1RDT8_9LAMI
MSPEIAMRVIGSTSSSKLWTAIEESYGIMNRSRIIFLTSELQRTRKGAMSIDQYLSTIKHLADNLEIAWKVISQIDLVTQNLSGLDDDNTPKAIQISSRESISWHELQSVLMTYESRLENVNTIKPGMSSLNLVNSSLNFVHKTNSYRCGRTGYVGRETYHRGRGRSYRQNEKKQNC